MAVRDYAIFVGIDIGTTNIKVSYIDPQRGEPYLITDLAGQFDIASVLYFGNDKRKPNERVFFGNEADWYPPSKYHVREVKRFIGKDYNDIPEEELANYPIEEGSNGECIFVIPDPRNGEEMRFTPEELLAIEIGHLKKIINQRTADCDFKIVMTVPPSFKDKQIDAMKLAFKLAGIEVITTMNEPSAAVYEYRMFTRSDFNRAIVIDIGKKMVNVSVCEQRGDKIFVKGNVENSMIGGSNFDQIMMDLILERLEENGYDGIDDFKIKKRDDNARKAEKKRNIHRLKRHAEMVKIELSTYQAVDVPLDKFLPDGYNEDLKMVIGREEYEERIRDEGLIDEIQRSITQTLTKSGIRASSIEKVILVGRVTFMPIIRQMISQMFGEEKIVNDDGYDPLTAVAKGAARYAFYHGCLFSNHSTNVIETIPESIGVEGAGGMMEWIAKKGQSTPVEWSKSVTTVVDNQTTMEFDVYKGESNYTSSNDYLTTYSVTGLERKPKGQIKVTFRITIEPSGNMRIVAYQEGVDVPMQEMVVNCEFPTTDREQQDPRIMEMMDHIRPFLPQ